MHRREQYYPSRERKSLKLYPHNISSRESHSHFTSVSPTSYFKSRESLPRYLRRRSSSHSNQSFAGSTTHNLVRNKSPCHDWESSNFSSHYLERSESPSHSNQSFAGSTTRNLVKNKSPCLDWESSNFSSHYLERSESPSHSNQSFAGSTTRNLVRNKSPCHDWESSNFPSHSLERSEFPSSKSSSHDFEGNKSSSHYLETYNSPSQYLEESKSPSHYFERDESPTCYFGQSGSPFHDPERLESSPDNLRSESPHYFRSKSNSPPPEVRCKSSPCFSDGDEFSPSYTEHTFHYSDVEQHHNNEISWLTSRDEMMGSTQFTKETLNIDVDALDPIDQHSPHTLKANMPQETALKSTNNYPETNKGVNRKVTSLEQVDQMSNDEIHSLRISGACKRKIKALSSNGVPYIQAKRRIIKGRFINDQNKQLRPRSATTTTVQHHVSVSVSHQSTESYSRFTKEKVNRQSGESSGADLYSPSAQEIDSPEQRTLKRPISEDRISQNLENKRFKCDKSGEQVAVVHSNYPQAPLGFDELKLTENAIMSAYESLPKDGPQIRFKKCQYRPGFLLITCADKQSADWLKNIVPELKPWKGAVLQTLAKEQVHKPIRCLVFVPDENGQKLSIERILSRLRIGNKGLNSHSWTVIGKKPVEKGQLWTFTMDIESLEVLKKLNMKAYFGFSMLKFKLRGVQVQKVTV